MKLFKQGRTWTFGTHKGVAYRCWKSDDFPKMYIIPSKDRFRVWIITDEEKTWTGIFSNLKDAIDNAQEISNLLQ